MRAGELKHLVSIEHKSITGTGDRGQPVFTWTALASNVPAKITPLTGRKLEIARQLVPTATHEVMTRYVANVTAHMRINFGGRILNIGNVNNKEELNFTLTFTCTEEQ